jgi:hypothetical protein
MPPLKSYRIRKKVFSRETSKGNNNHVVKPVHMGGPAWLYPGGQV